MSLKITLGSIIAYRNENHFQFIKFSVLSNFNFSTEVSNVTLIMTNFASIFPGVVQSFNFWMYKKNCTHNQDKQGHKLHIRWSARLNQHFQNLFQVHLGPNQAELTFVLAEYMSLLGDKTILTSLISPCHESVRQRQWSVCSQARLQILVLITDLLLRYNFQKTWH